MKDAGERLRKEAAKRRRRFTRDNWERLVAVGTVLVAVILPTVLLQAPLFRAFWLGVAVSSAVWVIVVVVREGSGASRLEDGATGEELTASRFIRQLERAGWRSVHDVEFDRFNVDHVVVGPDGILAIESKMTSGEWDICDVRTGSYLAAAVDQARFGADKIRKLLRADVGDLEVMPVVVCWGSGVANADKGHHWCDDVLVVVGRQASQVVDVINKKVLEAFTIDCAVQVLEAFVVDRERYARRRRP